MRSWTPPRDVIRSRHDPVLDIVDDVDVVSVAAVHGVGAGAAIQAIGDKLERFGDLVVAGAADDRVAAVAAAERVGAGIADDHVVQAVAGAADGGGSGERQVFDADADDVGGRAQHLVDAGAGVQCDVAGVVDDHGVVAVEAVHGVGARLAVENVVAIVARYDVAERVAGAFDIGSIDELQVLDFVAERKGDGTEHHVLEPAAGEFGHLVGEAVDDILVVALAAAHAVGTGLAVDQVVGVVAEDDVGEGVAEAGDRGAGQRQVLDVGVEDPGQETVAADDEILAAAGQLEHLVAAVHHVDIVAGAAGHGVIAAVAVDLVGAGVALQHVGAGGAGEGDGGGAEQRRVLDLGEGALIIN